MAAIFILALVMALFGILGYLSGSTAALITNLAIWLGLLFVARAGGRLVTLINTFYRFGMAGVRLLAGGGEDTAAALNASRGQTLISPAEAGVALFLLLLLLIVIAMLVARWRWFRGPRSAVGLLIGLLSGYLLGGYLLVSWLPQLGLFLPLPFGLSRPIVVAPGQPSPVAIPGLGLGAAFVNWLRTASQGTLAVIIMILIAVIVIVAAASATRGGRGGAGGGGRSGARQ